MRKILPYLVLNFVVSAAAVLTVLLIWNATHKVPKVIVPETPSIPTANQVSNQPPAVIPLDRKTFEIQMVVGAGDINLEHIQLISVADADINLEGWRILDGQKNEYSFPSIIIFPGGGLNIYTRSGVNTAVEVFWGREGAAWSSGETVQLLDPDGNLRASYVIP